MLSVKEEQIRRVIDTLDERLVRDALALFLAETDSVKTEGSNAALQPFANFAQAVLYLKSTYTFPELNSFTTEADLVYVQAADRRVLLSDRSAMENALPNGRRDFEPSGGREGSAGKPSPHNDMDNAFEPLKNDGGRFSHLEF